tara:strand:+ start:1492 stop:1854 length:363 start_codon:yes stop_codon:yes gene_type:complete
MKLLKNKQYFKYILSGFIFTTIGPSLFLFLCLFLPTDQAAILNELIIHTVRYKTLKYYVFNANLANPLDYLFSILPLSLFNISAAYFLKDIYRPIQIAAISILYSFTLGYFLTKYFIKKK